MSHAREERARPHPLVDQHSEEVPGRLAPVPSREEGEEASLQASARVASDSCDEGLRARVSQVRHRRPAEASQVCHSDLKKF